MMGSELRAKEADRSPYSRVRKHILHARYKSQMQSPGQGWSKSSHHTPAKNSKSLAPKDNFSNLRTNKAANKFFSFWIWKQCHQTHIRSTSSIDWRCCNCCNILLLCRRCLQFLTLTNHRVHIALRTNIIHSNFTILIQLGKFVAFRNARLSLMCYSD